MEILSFDAIFVSHNYFAMENWHLVDKVRPSAVRSLKLSNREPSQY